MSGGESQIQAFAGLDAGRVKDVVSAVWDSKDEVAGAVAFVRDHGDEILDLVRKLPEYLSLTSKALTDAAEDVAGAAAFLTGGPGPAGKRTGGVLAVTQAAGEALDACRHELSDAKTLLDRVGAEFAKVPIPSVEPKYSEVMGVRIISGLELGDDKLLASASERMGEIASRFDGVGERLAEVAEQLRKLGAAVDKAGDGLAGTATKLEAGGAALARFSS